MLFLEAVFGTNDSPSALRNAGWEVECFADHFRDENGKILDSVKDPEIIKFCASKQWVLITADKQMRFTHVESIKRTEIAIIATANNNCSLDVWVNALIKAKTKIERQVKKYPRPWYATISSSGNLNIETVSQDASTKRSREKEGQEAPRAS